MTNNFFPFTSENTGDVVEMKSRFQEIVGELSELCQEQLQTEMGELTGSQFSSEEPKIQRYVASAVNLSFSSLRTYDISLYLEQLKSLFLGNTNAAFTILKSTYRAPKDLMEILGQKYRGADTQLIKNELKKSFDSDYDIYKLLVNFLPDIIRDTCVLYTQQGNIYAYGTYGATTNSEGRAIVGSTKRTVDCGVKALYNLTREDIIYRNYSIFLVIVYMFTKITIYNNFKPSSFSQLYQNIRALNDNPNSAGIHLEHTQPFPYYTLFYLAQRIISQKISGSKEYDQNLNEKMILHALSYTERSIILNNFLEPGAANTMLQNEVDNSVNLKSRINYQCEQLNIDSYDLLAFIKIVNTFENGKNILDVISASNDDPSSKLQQKIIMNITPYAGTTILVYILNGYFAG